MQEKQQALMEKDALKQSPADRSNVVREMLDNLWFSPVPRLRDWRNSNWSPQMDIKETKKELVISAAMPGMDKKDIKVGVTDDAVTISSERREERSETGKGGYRLREQSYGTFYRSFSLPVSVKSAQAKAVYKDGIVKITVPKQKESQTRRLAVR